MGINWVQKLHVNPNSGHRNCWHIPNPKPTKASANQPPFSQPKQITMSGSKTRRIDQNRLSEKPKRITLSETKTRIAHQVRLSNNKSGSHCRSNNICDKGTNFSEGSADPYEGRRWRVTIDGGTTEYGSGGGDRETTMQIRRFFGSAKKSDEWWRRKVGQKESPEKSHQANRSGKRQSSVTGPPTQQRDKGFKDQQATGGSVERL